ncbi:MAG: cysteine desulfurase [Clostridia bacterium]|nr:cysteine desulfurase [Clostridia bacterium]
MEAYLDNSATTRPTDGVIDAMARCMREGFYNPSSLYAPALNAEKAMRACREELAGALSVAPKGILFTSGGTEANNLAVIGSVSAMHGPQRLLVSAVEHPSVLEAFRFLEALGHRVTVLGVDSQGQPDWAQLDEALRDPPALVSCMQVNNETGALPDIPRLVRAVREKAPGALIHVDGVQGFLRVPFDARQVDLYTMSAHKIHGPKGVGALYARPGVRLAPRQLGGGQEGALRSGTENTPGIAGFREAAAEMRAMPDVFGTLMAKKRLMWALFKEAVPDALLNGPTVEDGAPHILNVSFPDVRGEVMLHALEGAGVYCSTGSACSSKKRKVSPVLLAMGLSPDRAEWALRFSLSPHTTDDEIRYAASQLQTLHAALRRFKRR